MRALIAVLLVLFTLTLGLRWSRIGIAHAKKAGRDKKLWVIRVANFTSAFAVSLGGALFGSGSFTAGLILFALGLVLGVCDLFLHQLACNVKSE